MSTPAQQDELPVPPSPFPLPDPEAQRERQWDLHREGYARTPPTHTHTETGRHRERGRQEGRQSWSSFCHAAFRVVFPPPLLRVTSSYLRRQEDGDSSHTRTLRLAPLPRPRSLLLDIPWIPAYHHLPASQSPHFITLLFRVLTSNALLDLPSGKLRSLGLVQFVYLLQWAVRRNNRIQKSRC